MTTDLAARITQLAAAIEAQLTADEATAKAASLCAEVKDGRWYDGEDEINDDNGLRLATINSFDVTTHIARNDPARVLRRVQATRQLIKFAFRNAQTIDSEWGDCHTAEEIEAGECGDHGAEAALDILGIIASEWEESQ